MDKYVDEQLSLWSEPRGNAGHERAVVLHVLKHLNGNDAVI